MADLPFDVVVFDLDGTLADTAPDLTAALNHALERLGRASLSGEQVRAMVGHGARRLVEQGLAATGGVDDALIDEALSFFLSYYGAHIADGTRPWDGVEAALDALRDRGARLAICTNKPEALTRSLVDALGWRGRFAAIVGGDTLSARKPDPSPVQAAIAGAGGGSAVFVGDSINDTLAARAADIPCVALTFGFSDRPADQLGADALIDHFDALVPTLERLGG
jgi:phosphoglycolate phosphatase